MLKVQLTIKTSYLSSWGAYEGVRELIQNARDAEVEGHKLTVDWRNDALRIENEGTVLPLKALLLGHTTKEGRSDQIGKFGEGFKLGVLALVRAGHPVKIRNGSEVWVPSLERSEVFDEEVLTFRIYGGREAVNRVRVEIGGISKEAWLKMRECFLFLHTPKASDVVVTSSGTLLLSEALRGRVFVKGIFVQTDPDLKFGYDLRDAELDRDRRMVESWNLRYHTKNVFLAAMNKRKTLLEDFEGMLETPTTEVETILDAYSSLAVSEETAKEITSRFHRRYGEGAVPVANLAESREMEHLGKRGIVVPKQLSTVLAKVLGDAMTVKEGLQKSVTKTYGWAELEAVERESLTEAIELVNPIEPVRLDDIDVVDFRAANLMGQFKDGQRVLIAKKYLLDRDETLRILIHEVAHRNGGDGEAAHAFRVETIWKTLVGNMRRAANVGPS